MLPAGNTHIEVGVGGAAQRHARVEDTRDSRRGRGSRLSLRTLPFSTGKGQETEEETLKGNGNENGNGDKRTE